MYAGATVGAWYPITPSTSLMDAFTLVLRPLSHATRRPGERATAVVQAEDELAAIGIVIGADVERRARVHADFGPGISLMERVHRPRVLRGSAGRDLRRAARRPVDRHADAHAAMRPAGRAPTPRTETRGTCCSSRDSPEECFQMSVQAFDLAERLQTPVFVLLGPRHRHERLDVAATSTGTTRYRPDRGKMLTPEQIAGIEKFQRYLDPDGDGIPHRTLPGISPKASYFTRGSGHSQLRRLHRGFRRVPGGARPAHAEVQTAAKHVPGRDR